MHQLLLSIHTFQLQATQLQQSKSAKIPFVLPYVCTSLQCGLFPGGFQNNVPISSILKHIVQEQEVTSFFTIPAGK